MKELKELGTIEKLDDKIDESFNSIAKHIYENPQIISSLFYLLKKHNNNLEIKKSIKIIIKYTKYKVGSVNSIINVVSQLKLILIKDIQGLEEEFISLFNEEINDRYLITLLYTANCFK